MNRAERRRLDRESKKGKTVSTPIFAPVYMSPARVAMERKAMLKEAEKNGKVDEAVKAEAYNDGYQKACDDTVGHYMHMCFVAIAFGLHDTYGFAAKRVMRVWQASSKYFNEMLDRQEAGENLMDIERELNERLDRDIGLKFEDF